VTKSTDRSLPINAVFELRYFLLAAAAIVASVPAIAADGGISVTIGQPGFYGHIDIGDLPRPPVIFPQPVVIQPVPVGVVREPVYLRVPPGQAKNWKKHCRKYNACGQPVYFVQDRWYNEVYVPEYRHRHGSDRDEGRGHGGGRDDDHGKHRGKGHDKD
jgi:hypothetical protein